MHEEITIPELTEVVARVTALLGPRQGSVIQLEGGITNRNFRVNFGGTEYVVRLPGKRTEILGIDRTAECIANKAAAGLGMAPGVAAMFEEPSCLVTMFVDGREMSVDELRTPETLAEVARDLRRFHDSGTELPTDFDSFRLVEEYAESGRAHGSEPPEGYDEALDAAHRIEKVVRDQDDHQPVPSHNDLLTAYFGEPPDERRRATLKLFRFMSDFREAMWGVVQTGVSELDFDFKGYAQKHFDRLEKARSDPRFEGWIEAARA